MIGTDENMALVVFSSVGILPRFIRVIPLGFATLSGAEMDVLQMHAKKRREFVMLVSTCEETQSFDDLVRDITTGGE